MKPLRRKKRMMLALTQTCPPPCLRIDYREVVYRCTAHTDPSILVAYTLSYLQLLTLAGTYLPVWWWHWRSSLAISEVFMSTDSAVLDSVRSLPCLVHLSLSQSVLLLNFVQIAFVKVVRLICQNWYRDFYKLVYGFVKFDTWISLYSCYLDFSNLIHIFLWVVTWICLSCYMALPTKQSWSLTKACWRFYFEF